MRYKLLGRSGLRVSELALGTMTFGEDWGWGASPAVSKEIFDAYANAGGNFIDTANRYTNGSSEKIVGDLVAADREHFVLATKYSLVTRQGDPNAAGNQRKNMVQALEASLKRLKTDYLDLYWVHAWDFMTPVEEVMRGLDDLVRAGKVLYVGISDTPAWMLSLATMPANTMSSVTCSRAPVAFTAFARGVGGVAFTTKAASADGSSIDRLRYDRAALEGSRLIAEIRSPDGSVGHYLVEAPDWIHIPLARFVASGSDGAVTLFGTLKDQSAQEKLEEENDVMIVNYHPALQDTLLGLRLLQADMLAFEENATYLFRDKGQYILGAQQGAPSAEDLKTNAESFRRVNAWVERQPERYTSYVTCDVGSKVRYSISDGKLRLVGSRFDHITTF